MSAGGMCCLTSLAAVEPADPEPVDLIPDPPADLDEPVVPTPALGVIPARALFGESGPSPLLEGCVLRC